MAKTKSRLTNKQTVICVLLMELPIDIFILFGIYYRKMNIPIYFAEPTLMFMGFFTIYTIYRTLKYLASKEV